MGEGGQAAAVSSEAAAAMLHVSGTGGFASRTSFSTARATPAFPNRETAVVEVCFHWQSCIHCRGGGGNCRTLSSHSGYAELHWLQCDLLTSFSGIAVLAKLCNADKGQVSCCLTRHDPFSNKVKTPVDQSAGRCLHTFELCRGDLCSSYYHHNVCRIQREVAGLWSIYGFTAT